MADLRAPTHVADNQGANQFDDPAFSFHALPLHYYDGKTSEAEPPRRSPGRSGSDIDPEKQGTPAADQGYLGKPRESLLRSSKLGTCETCYTLGMSNDTL